MFSSNKKEKPVQNRLKELRKEAGLTQGQLGDDLGVTRQTVISIEKGTYLPSLGLALRMAKLFNKRIEDIFFSAENNK